jgi:hypothetical protein
MAIRPDQTFRFYERYGDTIRCVVCRMPDGLHSQTCPIVAIHEELQELLGHFGCFLADAKDRMEAIQKLLTGEAGVMDAQKRSPDPATSTKPH